MALTRRAVRGLILFSLLGSLPLFAVRKPDSSSSRNGSTTPIPNCPNTNSTPNFAVLDGSDSCSGLFPNQVVTLTDQANTFAVTITPALWINGFFGGNTILNVSFANLTSSKTLTLESFVVGAVLNNATYVLCDPAGTQPGPGNLNNTAFCTQGLLNLSGGSNEVLEPTPITAGDSTNTRWDFAGLTAPAGGASGTLSLVVDGLPQEFVSDYGGTASANNLVLAGGSGTPTDFLAVVSDGTNLYYAGTLTVSSAPSATNDLFGSPTVIATSPFNDFKNTSLTNPLEYLSGSNAGTEMSPQSDPVPQDPSPADPGAANCTTTWADRNRLVVFRSVWYTFTVVSTGTVTLSTDGSRYDTGLYVFTGSTSNPTPIACNDDTLPITLNGQIFNVQSSDVSFTASPGTYYVMISEVPPDIGTDQAGNGLAGPLANDATLRFNFTSTAGIANPSPQATLGSAPIFPPELVNTTGSAQPTTLTNTGSAQLTITSIAPTGPFAITSTCGSTLAPTASCTINVTFTPTSAGPSSGMLTITDNASNSPQSVNLSGTGTDFQVTAPARLTVAVGFSATSTITVAPVDGFSGTVVLACPSPVPSGVSCSFNPASVAGGAGTSSLTVTATSSAQPNTYPLAVTGTSGATTHNALFSLLVGSDFQISASPLSSNSLQPGQSATSTITITPSSGFSSAVTLACAITPTVSVPPTCNLAPNSLQNGSGTSTLAISTTAAVARLSPSEQHKVGLFYAAILPLSGLLLAGGLPVARRKQPRARVVLLCMVFLNLAFIWSCGGSSSTTTGSPGTTAGSYTVTVTASGGSASQKQTFTLTVQ